MFARKRLADTGCATEAWGGGGTPDDFKSEYSCLTPYQETPLPNVRRRSSYQSSRVMFARKRESDTGCATEAWGGEGTPDDFKSGRP